MDPEVQELSKKVDQLTALVQDTNHAVHKMRRGAWWGRIFSLVIWLVVLLAPVAAYYYYLQPYILPYIQGAQKVYTQNQNLQQQVEGFLNKYLQQGTTTQ